MRLERALAEPFGIVEQESRKYSEELSMAIPKEWLTYDMETTERLLPSWVSVMEVG